MVKARLLPGSRHLEACKLGATYISALHRTYGWEAMKSRYSLVRGDRILPATILGLSSQVPCTGADLLRSLMLLRGRILLATIFLLPSHGPCTTCRCLQGWLVWDQPLFQTTRPPTRCASAPSIPLGSECVLLLSRSSDHPMPASRLPLLHLSSFPCSRESIERLLLAPVVVLGPREPPAAFAISQFLREGGNIDRKNEFLYWSVASSCNNHEP